jgi:hypothetical protein
MLYSARMITRRRFLQVGVLGGLALSATRVLPARPSPGASMAPAEARPTILGAIVPVMLAAALPLEATAREEALAATITGVERAIAGLDPMAQKELAELFTLLDFAPTRLFLTGLASPWNEASPEAVARFLARWRHSFWALPQAGYQALHQLINAAWYGQPLAWAGIGYSGPPRLE